MKPKIELRRTKNVGSTENAEVEISDGLLEMLAEYEGDLLRIELPIRHDIHMVYPDYEELLLSDACPSEYFDISIVSNVRLPSPLKKGDAVTLTANRRDK
jgi:hypothetical protein